MIYNFFITISFLIIASLCNAMESNNKLDILAELTGITYPLKAQYITNEHIAVSGIGGCTIVNLKTKEAKKLQGSYCAHLDVDRDNKKIVFSHNQVIKVCDG